MNPRLVVPALLLDRVRRRGVQRAFALQFHPGENARTTIAWRRVLASGATDHVRSTAGNLQDIEEQTRFGSARKNGLSFS